MFFNNNFIWKFIRNFNCYLGVLVFIRFKLVIGRNDEIVTTVVTLTLAYLFLPITINHRQKLCIFFVVLEFLFSISYWKYRGREYCPLKRDILLMKVSELESKEFYENFYCKVYCISKSKTNIMHLGPINKKIILQNIYYALGKINK